MRNRENKAGLTLVEMLVVVAVIAVLTMVVISLAAHVDNQGKIRVANGTLALLNTALGQFSEYGYSYNDYSGYATSPPDERDFYRSLRFPPDCNGFTANEVENEMKKALDMPVQISGGTYDPAYSCSAVLFYFLDVIPPSREIMSKIQFSLLPGVGTDNQDIVLTINGIRYRMRRIVDPWGTPLRYDYYDEREAFTNEKRMKTKRSFPLITSAGPDRVFGTADDITNR